MSEYQTKYETLQLKYEKINNFIETSRVWIIFKTLVTTSADSLLKTVRHLEALSSCVDNHLVSPTKPKTPNIVHSKTVLSRLLCRIIFSQQHTFVPIQFMFPVYCARRVAFTTLWNCCAVVVLWITFSFCSCYFTFTQF